MSNREELVKILAAAREHSERLTADIPLARVRDEHIRVTARANEAANILSALEEIFTTFGRAASDE